MKNQKAAALLQQCLDTQSDFLGLGQCGLREIPADVFELTHLRRLNLGKRYYREGEWVNTENKEGDNHIRQLPPELAHREYLRYQELKQGKMKGMKKVLSNSRRMVDLKQVEFFEEVLEARSEEEVKRRLSDIVPKPKRKVPEGASALQDPLTAEALQQLKGKLKSEIGKDLEKALETANGLLLNCELKNELIALQGRYTDLKQFMRTGQLGFDEYGRQNNKIRMSLIDIVGSMESGHLDVEQVLVYL